MKEFVNKIQIAPVVDIESITDDLDVGIYKIITMKSGKTIDTLFSTNDLKPEDQDNEKSGNRYYAQSLKVICDSLNDTLYNRYRDRKVVIKLFDSDNEPYLMGNLDFPARSTIERDLNQDIHYLTCENPDPLVS